MQNFRGGNGGFGNMQNLMRQAQAMQEKLVKAQQELEEMEIVGSSGAGMVTVVMTGKGEIKSVKLKKEAVDPEDVEMLEDLILAAINDAKSQVEKANADKMGAFGNLGGLGGLL